MKYPPLSAPIASFLPVLTVGLLTITPAVCEAQTSTWNVNAAGTWGTPANWTDVNVDAAGDPADGAGSTANFVFDITPGRTVTLDTSRTIGNLNFDDTGAANDSAWTLAASGGSILTLENGGTSTITASSIIGFASSAIISAPLAGDDNVIVNHAQSAASQRSITINNAANSYTGTTTIQNGFVNVGANNLPVSAASPLGNSAAAIILGDATTVASTTGGAGPNIGLDVTAGASSVANFSIARNIDSSSLSNLAGRANIRFLGGTNAAGTLTVAGNWTLGTGNPRAYGLVAALAGQTLDFTGAIIGTAATNQFRINDFGGGVGVIRLSNAGNTYAGQTNVLGGTLLIAGDAASGTGVLGTNNSIQLAGNGTTGAGVNPAAFIDGAFTVAKPITLDQGNTNGIVPAVFTHFLGGTQAVTSTFSGNIPSTSSNAARVLSVSQAAGGTTRFTGNIGANANATGVVNLDKTGLGTAVLAGANVYDGVTRVLAGTLLANNTTGSATGAGATVDVGVVSPGASGVSGSTTAGAAALVTRQINNISSATARFLVIGQTVTGTGIPANSTLLSVNIGGGASDSSIVISNNLASIPASTTATFPDLAFGPVNTTGTLGGTGIVGGISGSVGAVTVNSGSSIAPGDPGVAGGIGTLTIGSADFNRPTVFAAGSTLSIDIGAASSDLLATFGTMDLSANQTLALFGTFDGVSNYTIATFTGGLTGTFDTVTGLVPGYSLVYNADNIQLTVIPEPGVAVSLLGGLSMLLGLRRRRVLA